jgi:phosphoribosylanthranilate isomerase
MRIKVCGITNIDDAILCQQLGVDAVGFILYNKSKRYVSMEKSQKIIKELSPFIVKIGVFVNESPENINKLASKIGLNGVQLHGEEPAEYITKIHLPVIKSFRIKQDFDYSLLNSYKPCYFLLDSFSLSEYGGTGIRFDWSSIPKDIRNKIILAGGISIENVETVFKEIRPVAIDISSSLEKYPGKKDPVKIKSFMKKFNSLSDHNNGNKSYA